jgi:TolB-like protein
VLEFENVTGDPALDWMKRGAAELVGSALVQSAELDVYDAQRLSDLKANESGAVINNAFLAKHGIARALSGTILRSGSQLQILGRIVDTSDGRPVHSYTAAGPADSGLFHVIGQLIPDLQVALEVNLTATGRPKAGSVRSRPRRPTRTGSTCAATRRCSPRTGRRRRRRSRRRSRWTRRSSRRAPSWPASTGTWTTRRTSS